MELTDIDNIRGQYDLSRSQRPTIAGRRIALLTMAQEDDIVEAGNRGNVFWAAGKPHYFAQHQVEALDLKQTVMREAQDVLDKPHPSSRHLGCFFLTMRIPISVSRF